MKGKEHQRCSEEERQGLASGSVPFGMREARFGSDQGRQVVGARRNLLMMTKQHTAWQQKRVGSCAAGGTRKESGQTAAGCHLRGADVIKSR